MFTHPVDEFRDENNLNFMTMEKSIVEHLKLNSIEILKNLAFCKNRKFRGYWDRTRYN